MKTYEFTLIFGLPNPSEDPSAYSEALFGAGCDDALLGVGARGVLAVEFSRESSSATEAVRSAISTVQTAIPGAYLVEVKPDLVNLSDIADVAGCSRQNIRKYAAGEIKGLTERFPLPVYSGSPSLWHLADIAKWLITHGQIELDPTTIEAARTARDINRDLQQSQSKELSEAPRKANLGALPSRGYTRPRPSFRGLSKDVEHNEERFELCT